MSVLSTKPARIGLRILFYVSSIGFCLSFLAGAFYTGAFAASFSLNICYNDSIDLLVKASADAINSSDAERSKAYAEMVKKLPLHGYETDCYEVKDALAKFFTKH